MTDDLERDGKLPPNEFVPGEDDFDEESEEGQEATDEAALEPDDDEEVGGAAAIGAGAAAGESRSRFGRRPARETDEHRTIGSVRGTHERVHIDDRPSAVFALICAFGLLGVLAFSYLGGIVPKAAVPTLTPLVLDTGHFTLTPATPTLVPSASPSVAPTASPTAAPTASPSAKPSPTK